MLIYCSGTSILAKTQVTSDISLASFIGEPSEWEKTDEARQLFECTPNVTGPRRLVPEAIERPKRGVREAFMKLFTTSTMGRGAATGAGKRDGKVQSNFRAQLLKDYESVDPVTGFIWCPILQEYVIEDSMTAAHIFSYKHDQSTMDATFSKKRPAGLFSQ